MPLVKSPQKMTVVHRIPAKIPTAAVIRRMYWISSELLIRHIRYVRRAADENPVAKRVILWYLKPLCRKNNNYSSIKFLSSFAEIACFYVTSSFFEPPRNKNQVV